MTENVVLLNEQGEKIGEMPKAEVHGTKTPLHLAFSCFLFNEKGELLLQQRAKSKKTWPGVWSNSVCGHPQPHEDEKMAVMRRIEEELGIKEKYIVNLTNIVPDFRYCAVREGIMENEICPVWVGFCNGEPDKNPDEVESTKWIAWEDFIGAILDEKDDSMAHFSVWSRTEATILHHSQAFRLWWGENIKKTHYPNIVC